MSEGRKSRVVVDVKWGHSIRVSQSSEHGLPSTDSWSYSFISGGPWATALWCTAFPSCALICVGSWISFLAFSCKSILIPKHKSELSGCLWREPGAFGQCPAPCSAQVTVLDLELWQSLPTLLRCKSEKWTNLGPCRLLVSPPCSRPSASQCREKGVFPSHT